MASDTCMCAFAACLCFYCDLQYTRTEYIHTQCYEIEASTCDVRYINFNKKN